MRIVLADDERDFVDVLAERLSLRGHAVRVAPDGAAALAALAEAPSDILVLDWFMPGLSGPEVLTREQPRTARGAAQRAQPPG